MNILKILGGFIGLVIVAFFVLGLIGPEVTYENEVTVGKPVEEAFAVFTDAGRMDQWLTGFKRIETVEGEPLTPGSTFRLFFEMEGEEMVVTETMTEFREDELFAFDLDGDVLASKTEIRFVPADSATTIIRATTTAEGKGLFWGAVIGLSGSMMRQQSQLSYDKLKEVIEADTAGLK